MNERRTISTTGLKAAATCLKSYEYSQVDKLARSPLQTSDRIRLGVWIHRALHAYTVGFDWEHGLDECREWLLAHGGAQDYADAMYARARTLLEGYFSFWGSDTLTGNVLVAEQPLFAPVKGTGWRIRATVDKLVRLTQGPYKGQLAVVEHKTTGDIPNATWRAIDPQTAIQYAVAKHNGYDVSVVVFDYILTDEPSVPRVKANGELYANTALTTTPAFDQCVPEIERIWRSRSSNGGDPTQYIAEMRKTYVADAKWYQRFYVLRPDAAVRESVLDARGVIRGIETAEREGRYPRLNSLTHCSRMCQYAALCASEYVGGKRSEYMRQAEYVIDDESDREGR